MDKKLDEKNSRIPERKTGEGITPKKTGASLPVDETVDSSPDKGRERREDVNGNNLPGANENNFDEDTRR
jgi:hypothetical protein